VSEPTKPSEALAAGKCVYCLGHGTVFSIIEDQTITCRVCHGTGDFTWPEFETPVDSYFVDDRHNLYCGWVQGLALRHGLSASLVIDEAGNFTNRLSIELGGAQGPRMGIEGLSIELIIPYPPEDWHLADN
jgi:hypothetical protein